MANQIRKQNQQRRSTELQNQTRKINLLQKKVTSSGQGKRYALIHVTSENKGKRTSGSLKHDANTQDKKMAWEKKLRLDGKARP